MKTDDRRVLPATAIPDGCPSWDTEDARRWTRALAPGWVPARRAGLPVVRLVLALGVLAAVGLTAAGLPPLLAALIGLQLVWLPLRPEIVAVSAPVMVLVAVVQRPEPVLAVLAGTFLLAVGCGTAAALRLRARTRQREAALAATGGATAVLPGAREPLERGGALSGLGTLLILIGAPLAATAGMWNSAEDRRWAVLSGFFVAGLGVTATLSGNLGRRRAAALRAVPAPVLRVLVREAGGFFSPRTEVFAADDGAALRPLFTVTTTGLESDEGDNGDRDDKRDKADGKDRDADEAELDDFLDRLDDERPEPLREAVLYGVPYDGAEVVLVSAAPKPDDPPVAARSTGPVRPLSARGARRRLARERRTAARTAAQEEEHRDLVAAASLTKAVPIRRWRAGVLDRLSAFLLVQWGVWVCWGAFTGFDDVSVVQRIFVVAAGLFGAARVPVKLCWRVTADRTGLWLNGLRGTTHIPWDDLGSVRRKAFELKLRWRGGGSWYVSAPRWAWYQRRRGLTHPYDALVAELTAMRNDPALRPTGDSAERERGRPLWPLAALFALLWLTAVTVSWVWL
ncbi:hypothetical protein ACWC24_31150 [Streptomyces sp. NPDC001443]